VESRDSGLGASAGRERVRWLDEALKPREAGTRHEMPQGRQSFVNLLRLLMDGPRPRRKMAVPYVTRGPGGISFGG